MVEDVNLLMNSNIDPNKSLIITTKLETWNQPNIAGTISLKYNESDFYLDWILIFYVLLRN